MQRPVRELESLRREKLRVANASVDEANQKIRETGTKGEVYEFEAELRPGQAEDIGFRLRKSKDAETLVGFDAVHREIYVDRTHSGEISFSKDFPGRHSARWSRTRASSYECSWTARVWKYLPTTANAFFPSAYILRRAATASSFTPVGQARKNRLTNDLGIEFHLEVKPGRRGTMLALA